MHLHVTCSNFSLSLPGMQGREERSKQFFDNHLNLREDSAIMTEENMEEDLIFDKVKAFYILIP